jgi:hypothetical protein
MDKIMNAKDFAEKLELIFSGYNDTVDIVKIIRERDEDMRKRGYMQGYNKALDDHDRR